MLRIESAARHTAISDDECLGETMTNNMTTMDVVQSAIRNVLAYNPGMAVHVEKDGRAMSVTFERTNGYTDWWVDYGTGEVGRTVHGEGSILADMTWTLDGSHDDAWTLGNIFRLLGTDANVTGE